MNDSRIGVYELTKPIKECKSLTMKVTFSNIEGHPEGMYYLYGLSEHGHWNQLGEFELASNKNNTTVTKQFSFAPEKHVSITALATALHERNRAYTGTWGWTEWLTISDVYVYD